MATSSITAKFTANEAKAVSALASGIAAVFRKIAPVDGKAILFGSRARGDAKQDSDWDVLVLLGKDRITASDQDTVAYPIHEIEVSMGSDPMDAPTTTWPTSSSATNVSTISTWNGSSAKEKRQWNWKI